MERGARQAAGMTVCLLRVALLAWALALTVRA